MLQIQNLTANAEGKTILNNLNLEIPEGEIHILFGPNGSGKSTLARLIAGISDVKITSSNPVLSLNKTNLHKLSPDQRAQKGLFISFQDPVEIEGLTTLTYLRSISNLNFPNKILGLTEFKQKLDKLAAKIGLNPKLLERDLNVGFSGGEKKRLELLQLLLIKPKLAILDEIDTGLDIQGVAIFAKIINDLAQKIKIGFLIITHNTNLIKLLNTPTIHQIEKGEITKQNHVIARTSL